MSEQFHFDPDTYFELMSSEVPAYAQLQDAVVKATGGIAVRRFLDLGAGTGVTAKAVSACHPGAKVVGVDESAAMLEHARQALPQADFRVGRLEDDLPEGPFELVVSALAVHHLDGPGKAGLFSRVAAVLSEGGRFVLGDVVVPDRPSELVTPVDGQYDRPSRVDEQLRWLGEAGLAARVHWSMRDLAVLVADLPARSKSSGRTGFRGRNSP